MINLPSYVLKKCYDGDDYTLRGKYWWPKCRKLWNIENALINRMGAV